MRLNITLAGCLFMAMLFLIFLNMDNKSLVGQVETMTELSLEKDSIIQGYSDQVHNLKRKNDSLTTITTSYTILTNIVATMYHPVESQCDSDPDITADGSKIDIPNASAHKWIAVSRDLLSRNDGPYSFGDEVILISDEGIIGLYQIRDVMNKCWVRRIDILETPGTSIYSYDELTIVKI